MFLDKVRALKKEEIRQKRNLSSLQEMKKKVSDLPAPRGFLRALLKQGPLSLIAEIKRASPSAGMIREDTDIRATACRYETGGAGAISVLTETRFFQGALEDLAMVKETVSLPVLQKDFIIDPFQIYEGRIAGADALLLIAAILERSKLQDMAELTRALGMFPLVEVHDEEDLEKTAHLGLPLLGINNRNLKTLKVNLENTFQLMAKVPGGAKVVSESGIQNREDVKRLQKAGVQGILVGEVLMRAADPAAKIRELLSP